MRNRSNIPPRDENAFIYGGTAGVDKNPPVSQTQGKKTLKAKPISFSLTEGNLQSIDDVIRNLMLDGTSGVNRSDVVRAALLGLEKLTKADIASLIKESKLR
ncbi:hypothetical protein [Leclercia adecarboxylata]|uniref:hypothetical protein n=1 Tax=Leclercia adecarboxylata TaxID=83655 RepID=UPI0029491378|nr:hypothetical protein [Leclercia adecarboxylata]MDV5241834.1 hypothetical protein [Leclercia adecarboxylata]MDV5280109.1 hypothetical protein [Leclercia adecarboxylata]MDV5464026.1 hypothetical protein [Leclercia adecarboxylata]MDV5505857.1 hypothetical protein [Leclercia adecarboxylata]MDV5565316.1 hypothetical protein [Leclercia adecarboxylata]